MMPLLNQSAEEYRHGRRQTMACEITRCTNPTARHASEDEYVAAYLMSIPNFTNSNPPDKTCLRISYDQKIGELGAFVVVGPAQIIEYLLALPPAPHTVRADKAAYHLNIVSYTAKAKQIRRETDNWAWIALPDGLTWSDPEIQDLVKKHVAKAGLTLTDFKRPPAPSGLMGDRVRIEFDMSPEYHPHKLKDLLEVFWDRDSSTKFLVGPAFADRERVHRECLRFPPGNGVAVMYECPCNGKGRGGAKANWGKKRAREQYFETRKAQRAKEPDPFA
jgi:hypothetical protein